MLSQFIKFAIVGVINTFVDFLVLNFLMWLTKIYSGWSIILLNSISFTCAVINSYFLNKHWTFAEAKDNKKSLQFIRFFLVSVGGILINNGIVYFGTTFVKPIFNFSPHLWANGVKVTAVLASLIWNFVGYKIWVFKNQLTINK